MGRLSNSWIVLGLACLAVSACAALEPRADPSRFFTLTPISQLGPKTSQGASNGAELSIGVGPVKLPGYLDREQIVTRVSQNRFEVAENDRWAEPLEENFTRVLVENLTTQLPNGRFVTYPWRLNGPPAYQLEIEVLRFEPNATEKVELIARWSVRKIGMKNATASKETRLMMPIKERTTEAAVAALSAALDDLSQEIAQALESLETKVKS